MFRIIFIYCQCIWCNFLFCIIGTLAQRCNVIDVYDEHVAVYQNLKSFSHYIPRQSCYLCLHCNSGKKGCETVEFPELPLYNNMLEFGFLGNDLPKRGLIRMPLNTVCYFQIEMQVNFGRPEFGIENKVTFFFWLCRYQRYQCESQYSTKAMEVEWTGCIFVSVMLTILRTDQIYVSVSNDCLNLASAIRTKNQFTNIGSSECYFVGFSEIPSINFQFFPDSGRRHEGLVLVLPCSPGGYVVNPLNGRLVYDYHCKSLFFPEVHGDVVEQIINEQYSGSEYLVFPSDRTVHKNRWAEFPPIYIDRRGKAKSPEEMRPFQSEASETLYRDRCDLYIKRAFLSIVDALVGLGGLIDSTKLLALDRTIPLGRTVRTTRRTTTTTTTPTTTTTTTTTTSPVEIEPGGTTRRTTTTTTTTTTSTPTEAVAPVHTVAIFFPDADIIKEMVEVTYRNQSSDILLTFEGEEGVFSPVLTLAPGEDPPPTPSIPLWIPDYEDVIESRVRHGRDTPRRSNYSRHHDPIIRFRNQTRRKRDNVFLVFDRKNRLDGVDYFGNLSRIDVAGKGTNLQDRRIPWVYKISLFISGFLLLFTSETLILT